MKFSVRFTGGFIRRDKYKVAELLSPVFLGKPAKEILLSISEGSIIKDSVSLAVANRIKTKIEVCGAECTIELSEAEVDFESVKEQSIPASFELDKLNGIKRARTEGGIVCFLAVVLTVLAVICSHGYYPNAGFLASLDEMKVEFFKYSYSCGEAWKPKSCEFYFYMKLRTILVVAILIFSIGCARFFGIIKPLIGYLKLVMKPFYKMWLAFLGTASQK